MRHVTRRLLAFVTLASAAWALAVWATGGLSFELPGARVSARDPLRPLAVALACAAAWVWLTGVARSRAVLAGTLRRLDLSALAALLAAASFGVALAHNAWVAGGADQFAYVSQMDLWLAGRLSMPIPIAGAAPWPDALLTFTPYGYRPAFNGAAIVPVTAPGFAWLMAMFKWVGGHCAAFLVAPLCGALLAWCTFGIGRRVAGAGVGLGAAWLLVTSPVVLAMSKATMSDVPAAAFWAAATWGALGANWRPALAGGLAASVAITIRPNLLPIAAVLAAWLAWKGLRRWPWSPSGVLAFSAGAVPGCLAVAWVNHTLYGSPVASGYGSLDALFSIANVGTNLWRYSAWLWQTQTPLALLGVVALVAAPRWLLAGRASRDGARALALVVLATLAGYLLYTPFEAWWYLRFLLPAWPALCVGTAVLVVAASRVLPAWRAAAATTVLLALGVWGARTAIVLGVYPPGEGERRYASIAQHVARLTEPSAVLVAGQHVGALRYYAGRTTLRFDLLEEAWLDRALAWLRENGHAPYLVLEDWELEPFARRFGHHADVRRMLAAPLLAYKSASIPGVAYLFDPSRADGPTEQPVTTPDPRPRCVVPFAPDAAR